MKLLVNSTKYRCWKNVLSLASDVQSNTSKGTFSWSEFERILLFKGECLTLKESFWLEPIFINIQVYMNLIIKHRKLIFSKDFNFEISKETYKSQEIKKPKEVIQSRMTHKVGWQLNWWQILYSWSNHSMWLSYCQ